MTMPANPRCEIPISCRLQTTEDWLELNDGDGYVLAKESFADRQVSKRKTLARSPYLEGDFAVNALRETVTETLVLYVYGSSSFDCKAKLLVLTEALDQIEYRLVLRTDNVWEVWFCQSANYRIETAQELLHARMAKVTVELPRHPVTNLSATAVV